MYMALETTGLMGWSTGAIGRLVVERGALLLARVHQSASLCTVGLELRRSLNMRRIDRLTRKGIRLLSLGEVSVTWRSARDRMLVVVTLGHMALPSVRTFRFADRPALLIGLCRSHVSYADRSLSIAGRVLGLLLRTTHVSPVIWRERT